MGKYSIVGFGGNFFITKGAPLSENQQYNFFHFRSKDEALAYVRDVLEPLDRELAEGPVVGTEEDF